MANNSYLTTSFKPRTQIQNDLSIEEIRRLLAQQGNSLGEVKALLIRKMMIVSSNLEVILDSAIRHTDDIVNTRI
jgi:hypothetical protein